MTRQLYMLLQYLNIGDSRNGLALIKTAIVNRQSRHKSWPDSGTYYYCTHTGETRVIIHDVKHTSSSTVHIPNRMLLSSNRTILRCLRPPPTRHIGTQTDPVMLVHNLVVAMHVVTTIHGACFSKTLFMSIWTHQSTL